MYEYPPKRHRRKREGHQSESKNSVFASFSPDVSSVVDERQRSFTIEMNENQQTLLTSNPEAAIGTPLFDMEATITAKPVEPLARRAAYHANAAMGRVAALSSRRRAWLLGLFVASALFVGVAGGFALALYGNRQTADAARADSITPPETSVPPSDAKDAPPTAAIAQTTAGENETLRGNVSDAPPTAAARAANDDTNTVKRETNRDSSIAANRNKKSDDKADRTLRANARNSRASNVENNRAEVKDERERRREERAADNRRRRQDERESRREARAIDRVGDVLSSRPRRASQRNAPEPRRVDRIRDIFEGQP